MQSGNLIKFLKPLQFRDLYAKCQTGAVIVHDVDFMGSFVSKVSLGSMSAEIPRINILEKPVPRGTPFGNRVLE
jgi:hypothetical protein